MTAARGARAGGATAATLAVLLATGGCDPRVTSHPLDNGPPPGPIGAGVVAADDGWRAPAPVAMPGMGAAMETAGAPGDGPLPEAIATGDGRGLPADGPGLYGLLCTKCHGPAGKADGPMAAMVNPGDLSAPETHARLSDDQIARLVVHGRKKMPAFGSAITAAQVEALVKHVRTLKVGS